MRAGDQSAGALGGWKRAGVAVLAAMLGLTAGLPAARAEAKTSHHHVTEHHIAAHHATTHHAPNHHVVRHAAPHHSTHHHVAAEHHHYVSHRTRVAHHVVHHATHHYYSRQARFEHSRLQCVPYAREISHIELTGDAFIWWAEAAGRYARGSVPVAGAVLNFRPISRMPLGHVAVVTAVINSRTILVTQANWVPGTITNDVTVRDVSPDNDWSKVKVELGDSSRLGATYPTYGFIYDHPAASTVIASARQNEVAEAPRPHPIASEAPDRNLQ